MNTKTNARPSGTIDADAAVKTNFGWLRNVGGVAALAGVATALLAVSAVTQAVMVDVGHDIIDLF